MSHQCVRCGSIYEDNDASILRGCKCGSIFFMYLRSLADSEKIKTLDAKLKQKDSSLEKELAKRIEEKKKAEDVEAKEVVAEEAATEELKVEPAAETKPKRKGEVEEVKFGIETIRIPREGVYEINIDGLMKDQPVVILERGKVYFIHLPSIFDKVKEKE